MVKWDSQLLKNMLTVNGYLLGKDPLHYSIRVGDILVPGPRLLRAKFTKRMVLSKIYVESWLNRILRLLNKYCAIDTNNSGMELFQ